MTLIKIKHFYDGAGNNSGDVWSEINQTDDWTEEQCREYAENENDETYVLEHNECSRPDYYMLDNNLPEWADGGWYDYDDCESRDEPDSTCAEGCDCCPHIASCYALQKEQQIVWIQKHGVEL